MIKDFDGEYGIIDFPLFEEEIEIYVEEAPREYAERCADYLAHLPEEVIEKLCTYSIRYCDSMRPHFAEMEISLPENISSRDILKYISPATMIVENPEDDTIAFHVELNCDWEEEHGLEWSIKDGEVLYVGAFNDESPWRGEEYFKNAGWNYANA